MLFEQPDLTEIWTISMITLTTDCLVESWFAEIGQPPLKHYYSSRNLIDWFVLLEQDNYENDDD